MSNKQCLRSLTGMGYVCNLVQVIQGREYLTENPNSQVTSKDLVWLRGLKVAQAEA
jgi:hypothetical protein